MSIHLNLDYKLSVESLWDSNVKHGEAALIANENASIVTIMVVPQEQHLKTSIAVGDVDQKVISQGKVERSKRIFLNFEISNPFKYKIPFKVQKSKLQNLKIPI
jgi:hypothetical protein